MQISSTSCLVIKSYPTLCDPMDQSTPGPPVFHCLPELGQIHVGSFDDTVVPCKRGAPFYDETALRQTFCNRKSDRFTMVSMGEFRFVMIGSLLLEPILAKR